MTTVYLAEHFIAQLNERIEYTETGVSNTTLLKLPHCQYRLLCLAAKTEIAQHTSPLHAVVHVLEGQGTLTLHGQDIALEPGVMVLMQAHAPHALKATTNLAFLLTLSDVEQ
ncbi:cupin domain-containing protein [Leptolyngbya sp. AN02str]|uniref:cupin domain-containing protein n=1 Tax=Leptolyngbya sp. AN02str TaxID=3423363 RepID=UPI003D32263D